jgi:alpha-L-arabinofuranosidase
MRRLSAIVLSFWTLAVIHSAAAPVTATVHSQPLNSGRISPMLFGNFIELLDDVVPSMWAEMLNDRSFEGIQKPAAWSYYDGSPDICDRPWDTNSTWSIDTNNVFNGVRCARITGESKQPGVLTQSGLATKKGMVYSFAGHFRTDNTSASVTVCLKTLLPTGDWMILGTAELPRLSRDWEKYSVRMTSKGTSDRVVFELRVKGQGNVWADKLSLMPLDNLNGWRRDVVAAIKETQPALVRFGGSACDPGEYRWKNGIGDRDLRVPFPNKVWGRLDPNDVGIDEFCQFCGVIGVEPLICLSFSDGPQNAADLVEYCNGEVDTPWGARRAANGHPAPYDVKYWQIGNEISGDDDNYVSQAPRFVALMRKEDPDIKILSSFPSQKLLDKDGKDLDFIAPHHYTPDLGFCDNEFKNLTRMIDSTPGCGQINIAITEWSTSGGNWGFERGRFMTLDVALRNARYIHVMMRHCDKAKIACRSNMANSYGGAIIETCPAGVLRRPSYYVMELYARHALPVPLTISQSGDSPDVFACASEDGKTLCLFAINYGGDPVDWSLLFDGFTGQPQITSAESMCDTEDTRQPDVMNHWETPDRIRIVPLPTTPDKIVLPAFSATAVECEVK